MSRQHLPLMLMVFAALLLGLWAGLLRVGWQLPSLSADFALAHGSLMVSGFMGTLISLERAAALHGFLREHPLRQLPYLAPLLAALGALLLLVDFSLAALLMCFSSVGMVLISGYIVYKQTAAYTLVMALGALCWLVGNLLWLSGEPLYRSAPWWMAFLVLTISGERLELSRLMRHARRSVYLFGAVLALLLLGLALLHLHEALGSRLMALGQVGLAAWLLRYDVIRRTLWQQSLPRYIAVCLGLGYLWLAASGIMSLGYGAVKAGMIYDAVLHAVFLGFAFSMIFGHAPIILPAVLHIDLAYSPTFYLHLALLHGSLLLRVGGDLTAWQDARRWGAMLNVLVLLLFLGNSFRSLRQREADQPLLPHTKPACATYVLVLPLLILGSALVLMGAVGALRSDSSPSPADDISTNANTGQQALVEQGAALYRANCASCHGANLQGVPGLGHNLRDSAFVQEQSDSALHQFIVQGRPAWDPANTTGIEMPPRGGNPSLSAADIDAIIAFIRAEGAP